MVERQLPKLNVVGSIPITRSILIPAQKQGLSAFDEDANSSRRATSSCYYHSNHHFQANQMTQQMFAISIMRALS